MQRSPTDPARSGKPQPAPRRFRFEPAGGLVAAQIRKAGEKRGFAVARLLTHWAEVAGPELAGLCRPQKISYAQRGFGATLILEVPGAAAPLVAMRTNALRERINAVYGYAAIARIQLVQTPLAPLAPEPEPGPESGMAAGLAEAQTPFAAPGLTSDNLAPPSAVKLAQAQAMVDSLTRGVADEGLKAALDRLANNVLNRGGIRRSGRDSD